MIRRRFTSWAVVATAQNSSASMMPIQLFFRRKRIIAGIYLFPSFIAADIDVADKTVSLVVDIQGAIGFGVDEYHLENRIVRTQLDFALHQFNACWE